MGKFFNAIVDALAPFLSSAGYERVGQAEFSCRKFAPAVEHFLFFDAYGPRNGILNADFGLRNLAAQEFGVELVKAFGHAAFRQWGRIGPNDCSMRFAFWRLIQMARVGWDIRHGEESARIIKDDLNSHLLTFVHSIYDLKTLFDRLVLDEEPCPWFATNSANRAAQIVYVSRMLGISSEEAGAVVFAKSDLIEAGLGLPEDPTPFLEEVLRRAYSGGN